MLSGRVANYLIAVASVGLAVTLKLLLDPIIGFDRPFLFLFAAVMVSAWRGGAGPGALATLLAASAAAYFFLPPRGSWQLDFRSGLQVTLFACECALIVWLSGTRRKSEAALDLALSEAKTALARRRALEEQIMLLVQASSTLLTTLAQEDVLQRIVEIARSFIAADAYAVWRGQGATGAWRVVSSSGLPEEWKTFEIGGVGQAASMLEGPSAIGDVAREPMLEQRRAFYEAEGIRSLLVIPMRIHGESSGTITFYYRKPHVWEESEVRVAAALGNLASAAVATAELYEEQRRLRAEADERARQAAFLAEASTALASSLDLETTLQSVARLAAPHFADWCSVDIAGENGNPVQLALAHADAGKVEWARRLNARYPPDPTAPYGSPQVMRTGRFEVVNDITDAMLAESARDPEHLEMLRRAGINAYLCVPLAARGRTFGAMTFVKSNPRHSFDAVEVGLAHDLARRAAMAMDNAALYRDAERRRGDAEKAAELLRQSNDDLQQFAYVSSHDLQEPLRTIGSYVQLLSRRYRGKLDANADEFIDFTVKGVNRMQHLLQDLLEYSRAGHAAEEPSLLDAGEELKDALKNLDASIESCGATITSGEFPVVPAIPMQLAQVFQNLIGNALKFRGSAPPNIHLGAERRGGEWVFSVRDNGVGFEPAYANKIFTMFQRLHGQEYSGTGVGLAICKRIVERRGGRIWAESKPGEGSTFYFSWPAAL